MSRPGAKNIFVSYRHVEPDHSLAEHLVRGLESAGQHVFWDAHLEVGNKWAQVIDEHLHKADFLIVLISPESMRSDMVRGELKRARKYSLREENPLVILPVRVAYEGELPYDLESWLDPIQYALWESEADADGIVRQIIDAVRAAQPLPKNSRDSSSTKTAQLLADATEEQGAPLPQAEIVLETGTMKLDSPFYVVRAEDARVLRSAVGTGTTTIINGARQVGKSSLLQRVIAEAKRRSFEVFYLDFTVLDDDQLKDLRTLFRVLARRMISQLHLAAKVDDFWSDDDGPKFSIGEFIRGAVLAQSGRRIVLFFDEVDRVFAHPEYRDDFFSTIRLWHNQRATDPDPWDRLNIVLVHSKEPMLSIQDINQSPFNVGQHIALREFDLAQVSELNGRYGSALKNDAEISQLDSLVGGHPYLVREGLYWLATNRQSIAELERRASENGGPFADHLQRYVFMLAKDPPLKAAFKNILNRGGCDEEGHFQRLVAANLVVGDDRHSARPRCRLYKAYFPSRL